MIGEQYNVKACLREERLLDNDQDINKGEYAMAGLLALASKPHPMTFGSKRTDFYTIRLLAPFFSVLSAEDNCSDSSFDVNARLL